MFIILDLFFIIYCQNKSDSYGKKWKKPASYKNKKDIDKWMLKENEYAKYSKTALIFLIIAIILAVILN